MTVHWNSRRGFAAGPNTTSSTDKPPIPEAERASLAELVLAMRKTPDLRASAVNRAKKLIAEADYPPEQVVQAIADLLAKNLDRPGQQ